MSEATSQRYQRWFTEWPSTHENAGQTVEVMPVTDFEELRVTMVDLMEGTGPFMDRVERAREALDLPKEGPMPAREDEE